MSRPLPSAPLMTIVYGLPATLALAVAPVLLRVTLATASALTRPTTAKWSDGSLVSNVNSVPYVLDWSVALIVSTLGRRSARRSRR